MRLFFPHGIHLHKPSRHGIALKNKAISSVLSTVILTSIMIIIAIMAMGFASNIFNIESQSVDFSQAKNTMVNFAGIVEQVSSMQGSSGYVLFNAIYGGPIFLSNVGTIDVTMSGNINLINGSFNLINGYYSTLKYKGGYLASVSGTSYLRGINNLTINNNSSPLGSVFVENANGSWIVLDYARISILNLGTFNFYNGTVNNIHTFETVNLMQVQYLNISRGTFTGSGNIYTVATCKNVNISYTLISPNPPLAGTYDMTFEVTLTTPAGTDSESIVVTIPNDNNTIVMVVNSDVEISMFGG